MNESDGELPATNRENHSVTNIRGWVEGGFAHSRISSHTPGRPIRPRKTSRSVTGGSSFGGTR